MGVFGGSENQPAVTRYLGAVMTRSALGLDLSPSHAQCHELTIFTT